MKTETEMTRCLNCGNTFQGAYCPHCGQKASTKRLQFTELIRNTIGPFVGGDGKAANTVRDLFLRPGFMVRDYLFGCRVRYYNPLQMFVFVLTTYAIVAYVLGIGSSIFDEMRELSFGELGEDIQFSWISYIQNRIEALFSDKFYGNFVISLIAIFPCRLVFRTQIERPDGAMLPLNLTEQFYVQMYHCCLTWLVSIILLPFCLFDGAAIAVKPIYEVLSIVYFVVMYKQILGISWQKSVWLNFLALMLSFLLLIVLIVFLLAGGVLVESVMK